MIKPKKSLGQNFLIDQNILKKIVSLIKVEDKSVLEIGPGTGNLTSYILKNNPKKFLVVEKDKFLVDHLKKKFGSKIIIIHDDILKINEKKLYNEKLIVFGNLPYNISTEILAKWIINLDHKNFWFNSLILMFQKEVAERICEQPGTKSYGVISVLTQAFYDCEYLFTVSENVFNPPPKVKSGVIRLLRKEHPISCNYGEFKHIVKTAFNQRRKMLRKSLKSLFETETLTKEIFTKRPEQLSVDDFVSLVALKKSK